MDDTSTPAHTPAGPLAGVRILDLSAVLSGPMATALLADQGAEVIKVEAPEGDTARRVGPAVGDLSAMFISTNRGKRSIALDLKKPAALELLRELAQRADVLVQNFRPGAMQRLGLGFDTLAALNPRLIYMSISGYGPSGPYAEGRVYDAVIQAVAGVAASQRDAHSGDPVLMSTAVCDKLTALHAAQAICAALFARERDGRGRHVELAMLDAALSFQWPDAMYNHVFVDSPPPPFPEFGATLKPWKTRDGFVATMSPQPDEFQALCTGFGAPELAQDPRFATLAARNHHGRELRALLEPLAAQQDTAPFVQRLRESGTPIGRVNERPQVLADPQVQHNQALVEVPHRELGRVRLARAPARFDGVAHGPRGAAPHVGEDGDALLRELGCSEERIRALRDSGALR